MTSHVRLSSAAFTAAVVAAGANAAARLCWSSAKIALDYPDTYVVDQVSLLETNGEWRILSTIFKVTPKASRFGPSAGTIAIPDPPADAGTRARDDNGLGMTTGPK
jgi:hypothetical protein